jgi:hypothetical protein
MKKVSILAMLLLVAVMSAYAQGEYPKFELSGMASMLVADVDILQDETTGGLCRKSLAIVVLVREGRTCTACPGGPPRAAAADQQRSLGESLAI